MIARTIHHAPALYRLLRPLLFLLEAEAAHRLIFVLFGAFYRIPGFPGLVRMICARRTRQLPLDLMGLRLPRPVGLAAGLD